MREVLYIVANETFEDGEVRLRNVEVGTGRFTLYNLEDLLRLRASVTDPDLTPLRKNFFVLISLLIILIFLLSNYSKFLRYKLVFQVPKF